GCEVARRPRAGVFRSPLARPRRQHEHVLALAAHAPLAHVGKERAQGFDEDGGLTPPVAVGHQHAVVRDEAGQRARERDRPRAAARESWSPPARATSTPVARSTSRHWWDTPTTSRRGPSAAAPCDLRSRGRSRETATLP